MAVGAPVTRSVVRRATTKDLARLKALLEAGERVNRWRSTKTSPIWYAG